MKKGKSFRQAFKHAWEGCRYAFSTQRNFLIHFSLSLLVIFLAFWLRISFERFLFLLLAIIFGLTTEMANTAFEALVDLVTEEWRLKAKIAKDVAAGMMLLAAFGLAVVGTLILLPPLLEKFLLR